MNRQVKEASIQIRQVSHEYEIAQSQRKERFGRFLERLRYNLDMYYKTLSGDDTAQAFLMSDNEEEPYLGSIHFSCIAPGKRFQQMDNMSGGERCLAVFALIYSCYAHQPPCFFILDEIDGSLDNENIVKVCLIVVTVGKRNNVTYL